MRISYRTHPILDKLDKGSLGIMPTAIEDTPFFTHLGEWYTNHWKYHSKEFKCEVNVISKPFVDASVKAEKNLLELWNDFAVNDSADFEVKGCYVIGDMVYMIDYAIKKGKEDNEIAFFIFDKTGLPIAMNIDSSKRQIHQNMWLSKSIGINDAEDIRSLIYREFGRIVLFKMFKTYAEVETKVLPPKSKIRDIACNYKNDTKLELNYLDSKWFTTLVQSEGFNVRGHFRLQPKKREGEWTKELIWISEFEKTGYMSLARKLNQLTQ